MDKPSFELSVGVRVGWLNGLSTLSGFSLGGIRAMVADVRQPEILSDPQAGGTHSKKPGKLRLQLDEMWSFVGG